MPLYLRDSLEGGRDDDDVEMAAFPGPRMSGVFGAVVADLEPCGAQSLFERGAQSVDARVHVDSRAGCWRMIQTMTPARYTNVSGTTTKDLKLTQVSWLMV